MTDKSLNEEPRTTGPLHGLRVLDLTQVMAGPACTMMLADMGADVIKVEEPTRGDQSRRGMGPRGKGEDTAGFLAVNRNKRSLALDLKNKRDLDRFLSLVATADVVVENFRPGVAERLGIGYADLSRINPALIYATVSGFGRSGPLADRPGLDLIAQGMTGLMSITGHPSDAPAKCGVPVCDLTAGMLCAFGILCAYVNRLRTGEGQRVDTSLYEAGLSLALWETAEFWATGGLPSALGSAHRMLAPYQAFATADGWITIGGANDKMWTLLCGTIGREDLVHDERFHTNQARLRNRADLANEMQQSLSARTTDEWVEALVAVGVPAAPIQNYAAAVSHPQTQACRMVETIDHPVEGRISVLGIPVKLSRTPGAIRLHPPLLGEHTDEILAEVDGDGRPLAREIVQ